VSSISTILLLRRAIASKLNTPGLTDDQKETFKRCLKWLGGKPADHMMTLEAGTAPTIGTDQPELIESEYRRLLKQQVLRVLCPDYEARAQALYDDYKLFATQWFLDPSKLVKHPTMGTVPINEKLIDELDRFRLGKPKTTALSEEDKKFRRSLETLLSDARDEWIEEQGEERAKEFKESWDTITPLANAIRAKLDAEIAEVANKLLSTEVLSELSDEQQKKLIEAKQALMAMGYCEDSLKPVLEYAKRVKVWAHKG